MQVVQFGFYLKRRKMQLEIDKVYTIKGLRCYDKKFRFLSRELWRTEKFKKGFGYHGQFPFFVSDFGGFIENGWEREVRLDGKGPAGCQLLIIEEL